MLPCRKSTANELLLPIKSKTVELDCPCDPGIHGNHENGSKSKGPDEMSGPLSNGTGCNLLVLFGLLLWRGQPFQAFQEFLLGHAFDRDLGIIGIHAAAR